MNKDDIRRRVKAHKALLDDVERATAAAKVFALLEKTAAFVMARNILMYHSYLTSFPRMIFLTSGPDGNHFSCRVSMV